MGTSCVYYSLTQDTFVGWSDPGEASCVKRDIVMTSLKHYTNTIFFALPFRTIVALLSFVCCHQFWRLSWDRREETSLGAICVYEYQQKIKDSEYCQISINIFGEFCIFSCPIEVILALVVVIIPLIIRNKMYRTNVASFPKALFGVNDDCFPGPSAIKRIMIKLIFKG